MQYLASFAVLCFLAASAPASPVLYTFEVIDGSITIDLGAIGPATVPMAGTFAMTVYASDGIIGESDTFLLDNANLYNDGLVELGFAGIVTVAVQPGSLSLLDFAPDSAAHIPANGEATIDTDVYVDLTAVLTGAVDMTFTTSRWLSDSVPVDVTFDSLPVSVSDMFTVSLGGTWTYRNWIPELQMSITIDQIVDIQARVIPDPGLTGFVTLCIGGAGAWLRRRRE